MHKDEKFILRCKRKSDNAELIFQQKRPIFITKHSNLTNLLIKNVHKNLLHLGVSTILSNIR